MLGDQRIDGRYSGDVDDGDQRLGVDNFLQQVLHDDLSSRAVEHADQRQRDDVIPKLHHRRRQFHQFLLLTIDHRFPALLIGFSGIKSQLIEQIADRPDFLGEFLRLQFLAREVENGLLERKYEGSRFRWTEALDGSAPRYAVQKFLYRAPCRAIDIIRIRLQRADKALLKLSRL